MTIDGWRRYVWGALALLCAGLAWGSWQGLVPMGLVEVLGFATGVAGVLLVVEENVWNFPVGIANNLAFLIVFFSARLYADMALQVVYVGMALAGWRRWVTGSRGPNPLRVTSAPWSERLALLAAGSVATIGLTAYLRRVGGAAPALDALTTVLSLAAQWLLNRKRIDNWYVWLTADVLYLWLYLDRRLYLTTALYAVFIGLCFLGLARWREAARRAAVDASEGLAAAVSPSP